MAIYYLNHTSGKSAGNGLTVENARGFGNGLAALNPGDEIRALANLPVETPYSGIFDHLNDKVRINSQDFYRPIWHHPLKRATATWTRSGTTLTITKVGHGLSTGDFVYIPPNGISDFATLPYAVATFMQSITVSGDTFTITCTNAGATSGWIDYVCKLCEPLRYFTWTRSGANYTCTTYSPHNMLAQQYTTNFIQTNNTTGIIQTLARGAVYSSTNTFTFSDTAAGASSGAGFYELGFTVSANVSIGCDTVGGMRNCGVRCYQTTAAAFTTGKVGYVPMQGLQDLSAYQILSFHGMHAVNFLNVRYVLCSDASGNVPIQGCDWFLHASGATPNIGGVTGNRYFTHTLTPYGTATSWTANQVVASGDLRYVPYHMTGDSSVYRCIASGTCGSAEPIWDITSSGIVDNTARWIFNGYENLPSGVGSFAVYHNSDLAAVSDVIDCMAAFKASSGNMGLSYENLILPPPTPYVTRNTTYSVDDITCPSAEFGSNMRYICVSGGITHAATEPTWNHVYGSLTTDGGSVWKNIGFQDIPYVIRCMYYENNDTTVINLHDGGLAGEYQSAAAAKVWSNGYCNPLFPPLLTQTAASGNASITVENSAGFIVGETLKISNSIFDEYTITSNNTTTNVIGVSPNIVTERAVGQVVRAAKKTVKLWKIRPHYSSRVMINASLIFDYLNHTGTLESPVVYKGGYDPTYTNIIGRTYIHGLNSLVYGCFNLTNNGYLILNNIYYVSTYLGFWLNNAVNGTYGKTTLIRNCGTSACNGLSLGAGGQAGLGIIEYYSCCLNTGRLVSDTSIQFGMVTLRTKGLFVHGNKNVLCYNTMQQPWVIQAMNATNNWLGSGENFFDETYLVGGYQQTARTGLNCGVFPTFCKNLKTDFMFSGGAQGNHVQNRFLNYIDRGPSANAFYFSGYGHLNGGYANWLMSENHQGVQGAIRWEQLHAVCINDTSIPNLFYKCSITSATAYHTISPCRLPIPIRIKVTQGVSCSIRTTMRRDSTNIVCGLRIDGDYNNLDASYEQMMTEVPDTTETITLTFTPSRTGIVEPKIIAYATDALSSFYVGNVYKV